MSELRKLTRLGGDVRKIAALLQSKGRGRDTILAHITPREAALLKARGGRGSENPETGLLEFEDDAGAIEDYQSQAQTAAPSYGEEFYPTFEPQQPQTPVGATPAQAFTAPVPETPIPAEFQTTPGQALARLQAEPEQALPAPPPVAMPQTPQMPVPQVPSPPPVSDDFMKRLGLAGLQAIPGVTQARRAAAQGRGQRTELEQMAAPYRAQAQQLTAQAQSGQLTPQAQQQLEAARAQIAQSRAGGRGGGVQVSQDMLQLERFKQQLLQQQLDMGLKLSGIADQIQMGAIRAGYQADQQVQQLTSQFYNNMFRTLFGQPGEGK